MILKGDQSTTRALNRRLILNCLRREGDFSRVDIAVATGLSPAAVTGVTAELIADGIVIERKGGKSSGGRRPIPLSINYSGHWSIGFKVSQAWLHGTLTDLSTKTIGTCELPLSDQKPATVAAAIKNGVAMLLRDQRTNRQKLVGVGVAMPGVVDVKRGVCLVSQRMGWQDVPIAELIASQINVPVWVENDVNAFAIAQQLFGHGRRRDSVLVLIVGTGVGVALMFNGQIHRGARFAAGEIGFPVDDRLAPTATEDRLSWDLRLSEPAMVRTWQKMCKTSPSLPPDLQQAALMANPAALEYLGGVGREIGRRLVSIIDLIDPEVVVIGGEAVRFGSALIAPLANVVKETSFGALPPVEIDWDSEVWSRGASALAIQQFFDFESMAGFEKENKATRTRNLRSR